MTPTLLLSILAAAAPAVFECARTDQDPEPEPRPVPVPAPAPPRERPAQEDILFMERTRIDHGDGTLTVVYEVGKGMGQHIRPLIERFKSNQGWTYENKELSILVVTDLKEAVDKMDRLLRATLTPEPQIRIEVEIIEVRWTKKQEIGFLGTAGPDQAIWLKSTPTEAFLREIRMNLPPTAATSGSPFLGTSFRFFSEDDRRGTIGGILQAFLERGRAEIKSNPVIWVRSGVTAKIHSGEKVPIPHSTIHPGGVNTTVRYEDVGITLEVTPQVVARDLVTLHVKPSVNAVLGRDVIAHTQAGAIVAPTMSTRSLDTHVVARTGEQIVIGGLKRQEKVLVRYGLPILMDIPILGALFSRREEQELITEIVFVLRPTIYPTIRHTPRGLIDPNRGPR